MMRLFYAFALAWMLNACGYHWVGQNASSDAVPTDADSLYVQMLGNDDALLARVKKALLERMDLMPKKQDEVDARTLTVWIEHAQENLQPTSFDGSGVANQYRLTISGNVRVLYQGKERWKSDVIMVQGDVFATGGAVEIEAQRERLAQSLRQSWADKVLQQMYSGF